MVDEADKCYITLADSVSKIEAIHSTGEKPPSFQIIGDNLDLYIHTNKQMGSENKNGDVHLFKLMAVKDEVHVSITCLMMDL